MPEDPSYQRTSVSFYDLCTLACVHIGDAIPPIRQYLLTPQEGPGLLIYYPANTQEAAAGTDMPREGRCDLQGHSVNSASSLNLIPGVTVNGGWISCLLDVLDVRWGKGGHLQGGTRHATPNPEAQYSLYSLLL